MTEPANKVTIGTKAPGVSTAREHCPKLRQHLIRRNIDFEEKVNGNSIIIEIRTSKPFNRNRSFKAEPSNT